MDFCMAERKSKGVNKSELKVHDRRLLVQKYVQ